MSSLSVTIMGIIGVVIGFIIVRQITGFIFRLLVFGALIAFLIYLYQSGVHTMIMAPGAPESELISSLI